MSDNSSIEWTDATWPVVAGCDDKSPGCLHCYAKRDSHRLAGNPNPKISSVYAGTTDRREGGPIRWTGLIRPLPERLDWPLKWKKPRLVFVCNESDLFHEAVPDEFIAAVFGMMAACPQHTFQVLTKRAERLPRWFEWVQTAKRGYWKGEYGLLIDCLYRVVGKESAERINPLISFGIKVGTRQRWPDLPDPVTSLGDSSLTGDWPLPNCWVGVSVEDQARKDRIDVLRTIPAAVRFLSLEPLLQDLGQIDLTGIHWVIGGGESGPGARPMHPQWARNLRDQCQSAGVPYFFKQWGAWAPEGQHAPYLMDVVGGRGSHESRALFPDGRHCPDLTGRGNNSDGAVRIFRVGKKAAGRMLDGRTWDEMPATAGVPR